MKKKQVVVSIRMPEDFYKRIKEVASRQGIPVATLIKSLLAEWLHEYEYHERLNIPAD